jgi:hypothetical protein
MKKATDLPYSTDTLYQEYFEDTKGAIRNGISKKNRQSNGQKKEYKSTPNVVSSTPRNERYLN